MGWPGKIERSLVAGLAVAGLCSIGCASTGAPAREEASRRVAEEQLNRSSERAAILGVQLNVPPSGKPPPCTAATIRVPPRFDSIRPEEWPSDRVDDAQAMLAKARAPHGLYGQYRVYVSAIHNCIHPLFSDSFLASLAGLAPDHALSNAKLTARVLLVIDGRSGALERASLVLGSGEPVFDAAAIASVRGSFPIRPVPPQILSSDGKVYIVWEFMRHEVIACTTFNTRLYQLQF
jgi:hypothetical protein